MIKTHYTQKYKSSFLRALPPMKCYIRYDVCLFNEVNDWALDLGMYCIDFVVVLYLYYRLHVFEKYLYYYA